MKIQIPQTPIIQPDGKITLEWRIFFNEVLRRIDKIDGANQQQKPPET